MRWRHAALAACLLALLLAALAAGWRSFHHPQEETGFDPQRLLHREFLAMGTHLSITVYRRDGGDSARANAAIDDAVHDLQDFGRDWWAWGDGALGTLNRDLAAGKRVTIPERMQALFQRAAEISQVTGGLFEPRIGALVRLWGFDDITRLRDRPPPDGDIAAAVAALHAAPLYDGSGVYGPAAGISWDFGAIAKGYCVDRALGRLRKAGYADAVVDAGGNLAVRGRKGDQPWRIAIRHPRAEAGIPLLATLAASDEAVNTHGDYERHIDFQGRRYGHILNPATGYPADSLVSVTVIDADGTRADGAGAALFVAGAQGWRALSVQLKLSQVMVVDRDGGISVTPALARRLEPAAGIRFQVVP